MNNKFFNRKLSGSHLIKGFSKKHLMKSIRYWKDLTFIYQGQTDELWYVFRTKGQIDESIYLPSIDDLLPETLKTYWNQKIKEKQIKCGLNTIYSERL